MNFGNAACFAALGALKVKAAGRLALVLLLPARRDAPDFVAGLAAAFGCVSGAKARARGELVFAVWA